MKVLSQHSKENRRMLVFMVSKPFQQWTWLLSPIFFSLLFFLPPLSFEFMYNQS